MISAIFQAKISQETARTFDGFSGFMPVEEQRRRMGRMRETLQEYNIYRWAGKLIAVLARLRFTDGISTTETAP
jgi:trehalose-6-phosphate synthase